MSTNDTQNTTNSLPKQKPTDLSIISEDYLQSNIIIEIEDSNEEALKIRKEEQEKVSQNIEITVELSNKSAKLKKKTNLPLKNSILTTWL